METRDSIIILIIALLIGAAYRAIIIGKSQQLAVLIVVIVGLIICDDYIKTKEQTKILVDVSELDVIQGQLFYGEDRVYVEKDVDPRLFTQNMEQVILLYRGQYYNLKIKDQIK